MVELLEDLGRQGVQCELVTGWLDWPSDQPPPFAVRRAAALVKASSWKRLWAWGRFTLQAMAAAVRRRRWPMLVVSNPPWTMLAMPLLRRLTGLRYVLLVYDIYPDVMERMGTLRPGGLLSRLWRRLSRRAILRSRATVTLGDRMARTLRGHLRPGDRAAIEIIPNWADTDFIRPLPKADNPFAREHGLADKFVVLYSGAFGATHDTASIVAAAEMLADLGDVRFVLIGGGTRQREVAELVARKALPNLVLLPLQPRSMLPFSLTSADCAIVCLDEGYEGVSVPSKTYHALAAGSALLAVSPPDTELTQLVEQHGCGVHILPRRPQELASAIRRLHADPALLASYRAAARAAAEGQYSRRVLTQRWLAGLNRWLASE